jgi:hypothetical protein
MYLSSAASKLSVWCNLTFIGPCIVIYLYSKTNEMHKYLKCILFCSCTLHVSNGLSVHHQVSKIVHTAFGICQTASADCMLAGTRWNCSFISFTLFYHKSYVCASCAVANNARYLYLSNTTEHRSLEVAVVNVVKKFSPHIIWEPKVYNHIQKSTPISSDPYFEPNILVHTLILFVRNFSLYCHFVCVLSWNGCLVMDVRFRMVSCR